MPFYFSIRTIVPKWDRLWQDAQRRDGGQPHVLVLLFKAFGWTYLTAGLWQLIFLLLQFVNPLLLSQIISFVQVSRNNQCDQKKIAECL